MLYHSTLASRVRKKKKKKKKKTCRDSILNLMCRDGPCGSTDHQRQEPRIQDVIATSIYYKCLVGPSNRPICTRCCFAMTHMIQVCSKFLECAGTDHEDQPVINAKNLAAASPSLSHQFQHLIAASIYDKYLVGPSIRPICTRYCFTMTNVIQVCSRFSFEGFS